MVDVGDRSKVVIERTEFSRDSGSAANRFTKLGVAAALEAIPQGIEVARMIVDEPVEATAKQFACAIAARRDDWQSTRHRLQHGEAARVVVRWQDEDVGGGIVPFYLLARTGECHTVPVYLLAARRLAMTTDNHQMEIARARGGPPQNIHERGNALQQMVVRDTQDGQFIFGDLQFLSNLGTQSGAGLGAKVVCVDAVENGIDTMGSNPMELMDVACDLGRDGEESRSRIRILTTTDVGQAPLPPAYRMDHPVDDSLNAAEAKCLRLVQRDLGTHVWLEDVTVVTKAHVVNHIGVTLIDRR